MNSNIILRAALVIILLTHSIPSIVTNNVSDFGNLFLNQIGFAPFGLYIAWAVKLSHIAAAVAFIFNKYVKWAAIVSILVLIAGIVLVHFKEGWFVVGGGRNGVEYNFLLICVLATFLLPSGKK